MDVSDHWVAKSSHCHISLGDPPVMFPFSFHLFFIASNHFFSLPPTFCSTFPGDLATVSISLLSLFHSLLGDSHIICAVYISLLVFVIPCRYCILSECILLSDLVLSVCAVARPVMKLNMCVLDM